MFVTEMFVVTGIMYVVELIKCKKGKGEIVDEKEIIKSDISNDNDYVIWNDSICR